MQFPPSTQKPGLKSLIPTFQPPLAGLPHRIRILPITYKRTPTHRTSPEAFALPHGIAARSTLPAGQPANAGAIVLMHANVIVPGDPALLRICHWGLFAGEAFIVRAAGVVVTVGGVDDVSCGD